MKKIVNVLTREDTKFPDFIQPLQLEDEQLAKVEIDKVQEAEKSFFTETPVWEDQEAIISLGKIIGGIRIFTEKAEEKYSIVRPIPVGLKIFRISALATIFLSPVLLCFGISVYIVLVTLLGGIGWLITAQADISDWNAKFRK